MISAFGIDHGEISKVLPAGPMALGYSTRIGGGKGVAHHAMHALSTAKKVKTGGLKTLKGGQARRVAGAERDLARLQANAAETRARLDIPLHDRPLPKGRVR